MNVSTTLSRYIGKYFFLSIIFTVLALTGIISLVEFSETLRRAAKIQSVPFGVVIELVALRVPTLINRLIPYAVLIGSMLALTRLTRTNELVVARAAGVSVWQFLLPAIAVVALLSAFMVGAFNPLASALFLRYEQIEAKYFTGRGSLMVVSSSGLWMRQMEEDPNAPISEHIINAARISSHDMKFSNVMILSFDQKKNFVERLNAEEAFLKEGELQLFKVTRYEPGKPPQVMAYTSLPTSLTLEYIQDSFASASTISFWKLPSFIAMLEQAGFSAIRHRLYYQSLLASPILLAGMVWIAAVFSLRLPRHGKLGILIVGGLLTGFLLYFFTDLVHALGAAGTLPIALAAWAPALVMAMIGAVLLLHIEDG